MTLDKGFQRGGFKFHQTSAAVEVTLDVACTTFESTLASAVDVWIDMRCGRGGFPGKSTSCVVAPWRNLDAGQRKGNEDPARLQPASWIACGPRGRDSLRLRSNLLQIDR